LAQLSEADKKSSRLELGKHTIFMNREMFKKMFFVIEEKKVPNPEWKKLSTYEKRKYEIDISGC
jgi:hypothetical protein